MGGVKLRKVLKRKNARRDEFDRHDEYPNRNPGKVTPPMRMHRPGSNNKLPDSVIRGRMPPS